MNSLALAKNISIRSELTHDLPKISGDLGQVTRVMNNLLSNGIKFTERGGMIKVRTSESLREGIGGVEAVVEDNGVGVSDQERPKLFAPFHRGREKGTDGEIGSGLGLSICKEIMELHRGSIELDNSALNGSRFRLWFPIAQSHRRVAKET